MAPWNKLNYRMDCLRTIYPIHKYSDHIDLDVKRPRKHTDQYWIERRLLSLVRKGIIIPEIKK